MLLARVPVAGALDATVSWNGLAGVTGNLTGTITANYHPAQHPVASLGAKATFDLGACLACFWDGSPARVSVVSGTIFDKVIATWDTAPPRVPVSTPPQIVTTSLPAGTIGVPYSQRLRTADNRNGTWALVSGLLPNGLTLSGDTITGTPTQAQTSTFQILFTDTANLTARQTLNIVSGMAPGSGVVRLSTGPDGKGTSGESLSPQASNDGRWAVFLSAAPEYGGMTIQTTDTLFSWETLYAVVLADVVAGTSRTLWAPPAPTQTPAPPAAEMVSGVTISGDGSTIVMTTSYPGRLWVLDRVSGQRRLLADYGPTVNGVVGTTYLSDDGRKALTTVDTTLSGNFGHGQSVLFDVPSGTSHPLSLLSDGQPNIETNAAKLSDDGRFAYFIDSAAPRQPGDTSPGLFRRDAVTGETVQIPYPVPSGQYASWSFALSQDGGTIAQVDGLTHVVSVLDLRTGARKTLVPFPPVHDCVSLGGAWIAVSNDGNRFYSQDCVLDNSGQAGGDHLWSFDVTTGVLGDLGSAAHGGPAPFGDLAGIAFAGDSTGLPPDGNTFFETYLAWWGPH